MTLTGVVLASAGCSALMFVIDTLRARQARRLRRRARRLRQQCLDEGLTELGMPIPADVMLRRPEVIEEMAQRLTREGTRILQRERMEGPHGV